MTSPNYDNVDEASSLLSVVIASPAPSSSSRQDTVATTKKKNGGVPMRTRTMIVTTCFLLGTIAAVYYGGSGSSNTNRTASLVVDKVAVVAVPTGFWDDSCATEVYGAGPCCDGHPVDTCSQVCDWLLLCDDGYVPELTDDEATRFPETSDYKPFDCQCRGFQDPGCFCRQVRDMVYKFENNDVIGDCDPCLPPPTPAPTPSPPPTTPVYDPSQDNCFKAKYVDFDQYCWYPTNIFPSGCWERITGVGYNNCGPKCTPQVYVPSQDFCFTDNDNFGKFCWYPEDKLPIRNWKGVAAADRGYNNDCGPKCTAVDGRADCENTCYPAVGAFNGISTDTFFGKDNPFQTCYQYGTEAKYCWSESYFNGDYTGGYHQCLPQPKHGAWKYHSAKNLHPNHQCGPPCQEMYQVTG